MTDNIALITGANRGIGYEVARGLGRAGLTVLLGARSAEPGEAAAARLRGEGLDARFVQLDVTDADSVAAAAAGVAAEHDRLDILVNNAGIASVDGRMHDTGDLPLEHAREIFEVNVIGVMAVTNALLPLLRRAPAARIVNVSSEVGSSAIALDESGPLWQLQSGAYGASKAALNRLTVSYAKQFWDSSLRFNAVSPGYCATGLNDNSGYRTAEQGAGPIVAMALRGADSPNAEFHGEEEQFHTAAGTVPW